MAGKVTYLWKLTTRKISTPFQIKGYRLSAGFWFRFTKDVVNPPPQDEDVSIDRTKHIVGFISIHI